MKNRNKLGQFIKGHPAPKTAFKKGQTPWNKGKKYPQITGKKHFAWKGQGVSYNGIHHWVHRELGRPTKCEFCGKENPKDSTKRNIIFWANKSHKYLRKLDDWIMLCGSCHYKYDN